MDFQTPRLVSSLHHYLEQVGHPEGNHVDVLRWCALPSNQSCCSTHLYK